MHDFGSLDGKSSELSRAFAALTAVRPNFQSLALVALGRFMPFLSRSPTKQIQEMNRNIEIMHSEGRRMLAERKDWADEGSLDERSDLLSQIYKASLKGCNSKDKL